MRKFAMSAICLALSIVMICTFASCGGASGKIKDLVSRFEASCNTLDPNAVLDCIDPKISDTFKLGMGLVGMFTGTNTDEMFEKLGSLLTKGDVGGKDFFESIEIEVEDVKTSKDKATVEAKIKYDVSGVQMDSEAVINCIQSEDEWYISGFSFK